jgi:SAM-dependent methyltransferase
MIKKIKLKISKQDFDPDFLGIFFNPFYFSRKYIRDAIKELSPNISGNLLDIGCGSKPYQSILSIHSHTGMEIDSEIARQKGIADIFYDGVTFPFPENSFDSALCNQVLEHVFNPDIFLSEIARILKPDGKLLLTVPFVWDEHEQPYDFARYSSFGVIALLEKNGFKVIHHKKLGANPICLFQLTNAYIYKVTQKCPKPIQLLFTISVMALVNFIGIIASVILPQNTDLFLDHAVLAEKVPINKN